MTEPSRRIVICGRSIFAMVVEMSLIKLPGVDVTRLDPQLPGALERITALTPDVVLTERDSGQSELALALLGMGIPLIELDGEAKQATALTGQQLPATGVDDLAQIIEHLVPYRRSKQWIPPRNGKEQ